MPVRRSLYWRLNWYRQSELEGALLLGGGSEWTLDPRCCGSCVLPVTKPLSAGENVTSRHERRQASAPVG